MSAAPEHDPGSAPALAEGDGAGLPIDRRTPDPRRDEDRYLLEWTSAGMELVKALRTHGHLAAQLDPLGFFPPPGDPALSPEYFGLNEQRMGRVPASVLRTYVPGETLAEVYPQLKRVYSGTIAYEIEHLSSHEQRVWLREQIESRAFWIDAPPEEARRMLIRLLRIEGFEQYLRRAFLGAKQFSIEGLEMMILMLDEAIALAAAEGVEQAVFGMAHRGRLNVLAHVLRRPYAAILAEFEGEHAADVATQVPAEGAGDVKYHLGATSTRLIEVAPGEQREINLALLPNPSHLEFVDPVVLGRTRALQTSFAAPSRTQQDTSTALAVQIHGDAAFSGQGIVAETLNLQALRGYNVGGSLHLISNNQIGFTTEPTDSRSTRYSSDLAKGFDVPIIHVNADDLRASRTAIHLAMAFRRRFKHDIVIDLVGYRRWGHNEGDEPAFTQPQEYEVIKDHPQVGDIYAERLIQEGVVTRDEVTEMKERIAQRLQEAHAPLRQGGGRRDRPPRRTPHDEAPSVRTALPAETLRELGHALITMPEGFTPHPKMQQQLDRRGAALDNDEGIDWGQAESLAFASLLRQGTPIRITGQDTERGTFSHRHAVLHDVGSGETFTPLEHVRGARAGIEIHNSPLSENACLGFEYGYAVAEPDALVLWEAQFGDFSNGAQVIIDQFIMASASKWGQSSRLTLLLPHGYEGNGPEHSSARLERFLKGSAEDNVTIAVPSTAAQFYHLLRRQALRPERKPLIVMTPKSLLRLKDASSSLTELAEGSFQPAIDDRNAQAWKEDVTRVVLCSGKVYYDIQRHARRAEADTTAVVRVERLYPFPTEVVRSIIASYAGVQTVVWAQEEPQNMGGWRQVRHRLEMSVPASAALRYCGRTWRASPAEGYPIAHQIEQDRIVREALGLD